MARGKTAPSAAPATSDATTLAMAVIVHPKYQHTLPVEPAKLSFWEQCCDEVLHRIAQFLGDAKALASLQLVNRRCSRIAASDALWQQLCVAKFNCPPEADLGQSTWQDAYRFNHEAFKYLLAQTAAEALMKLGIRASSSSYVLNMSPMVV